MYIVDTLVAKKLQLFLYIYNKLGLRMDPCSSFISQHYSETLI